MEVFDKLPQREVLPILAKATIFSGIGIAEQKMLADRCVLVESNPEEIIIEQGDVGDRLYIIIKGRVMVSIRTPSFGWKYINILGAGEVFGEIAILHHIHRTARITAISSCKLLTINAKDFLAVYQYFSAKARDNIQLVIRKRLQEQSVYARL